MSEFETLFAKVEKAIDEHPRLRRLTDNPVLCSPTIKVSRLGFSVEIHVKLQGSRKRPTEICGHGDTAAEAVDKLIEALDYWAQAIE